MPCGGIAARLRGTSGAGENDVRRTGILETILALLLAAALGPVRAGELRPGSAQWPLAEQLIANERAAWENYARRDLAASAKVLAEDYADVQTDGTVLDRAGHLAFVPEANLEWHELDRFHVFLLAPDAAVVTYRARARDRGAQEEYQAEVTAGWSLRAKRWVNSFYRETPTPPEPVAKKPE